MPFSELEVFLRVLASERRAARQQFEDPLTQQLMLIEAQLLVAEATRSCRVRSGVEISAPHLDSPEHIVTQEVNWRVCLKIAKVLHRRIVISRASSPDDNEAEAHDVLGYSRHRTPYTSARILDKCLKLQTT